MSGTPYFFFGTSKILLPSTVGKSQFIASLPLANSSSPKFEFCDGNSDNCVDGPGSFNIGAFLILAGASFLNGIGYTSFWTIGLPYLDDNTKKGNSPIYISISTVIRMMGVTFGYFLSSFFLRFYENPFIKVPFTNTDPRQVKRILEVVKVRKYRKSVSPTQMETRGLNFFDAWEALVIRLSFSPFLASNPAELSHDH